MGNLLGRCLRPPRRRPLPGRSRPLGTPACDTARPGRDHPAVPAPAPCSGRRPFPRDRRPLPARCHGEPRRRYPLPQAAGPPLGLLPVLNWRDPPGQPGLSARSSLGCRPSRTGRIPALGRAFRRLHSLPAQGAKAASQVPSPPRPLCSPQGTEDKVPEHPGEQTEALGGSGRPRSSGGTPWTSEPPGTSGVPSLRQASPATLDRRLVPSGESSWDSTPRAPRSSSEGRVATSSRGPVGDALAKADRDAAVLSGPSPSCPLPQGTCTEEAEAGDHRPVQSTRGGSRRDTQAQKPSGVSPRSPLPPARASSRQNKRKIAMPLCLPLPPPLPLLWDRGDLPAPPKLPCLALDKNLGTLPNTECPRNKLLKDRTKIAAGCWAARPAPCSPPLASEAAGSPPAAAPAAQVPAPPTASADPSARPPTLSVPPASPTQPGARETGPGVPKSPPLALPADALPALTSSPIRETPLRGGPLPPGRATAPTSDRPTPSSTSTSLHPPSCAKESPTPMCVDSPPLFLTTPLPGRSTGSSVVAVRPGTSKPTSSTIAAKSSTLTSKPISNPAVVDMDTTSPSRAVIVRAPPHSSMSCPPCSRGHRSMKRRCPAKVAASASLPASMAPGPTPLPDQLFSLHITPQPTHGTLAGRQPTAFLPGAPIATGLPNLSSGATTTPVGSTSANLNPHSDPDAMDTTSPSRAVIFHTPPGSQKNRLPLYKALPASGNTPPSSSTALAHGSTTLPQKSAVIQASVSMHPNPGIAPHSDPDAMDTTSPSRAVIFHSPPGSQKNHLSFYKVRPGSGNTPPTSSTALAHGSTSFPQKSASIQTPVPMHPNPGIASQPTIGGHNGQQPNNSSLLGKTVAPTQAIGLATPITQPPGGTTMQSGFAGSPFGTTVNKQTAFGNQPGILHTPRATTTGFGGPTGIPSTGNGSSPVTGTTTGPQTVVGPAVPSRSPVKPNTTGPQTFVGPAVPSGSPRPDTTTDTQMLAGPAIPMDGLNVSTPGSIPSQASGAFNVGAGLKATSSTPSARPLGQIASNPSHGSPAAAIGRASTVPVVGHASRATFHPGTRGPPAQITGGTVMGNTTIPPVGGAGAPTASTCPQGSPGRTKSGEGPPPSHSTSPCGNATTTKVCVSKLVRVSLLQSTRALPGHTTSLLVARSSTEISVLRCTSSSTFPPGTRGPPAQQVSGVKAGNNITPTTGRPGIPALCQHTGGPPDASTDENIIVSMMAALCIGNRPQTPGGLPVSKAPGAPGNSTVPTATGHHHGPPFLQSTQNPRKPQHWWCNGGYRHAF
uniref:Nuclear pore associated protein 1 n=1 Tax=Canis lupus familiaris TaxID=9615 RepID=A0A8C0M8D2_CANLF